MRSGVSRRRSSRRVIPPRAASFLPPTIPSGCEPRVCQRRGAHAWAPDYSFGAKVGLAEPFMTIATEPDAVEQGFDALEIIAPSVAADGAFRTWWDQPG